MLMVFLRVNVAVWVMVGVPVVFLGTVFLMPFFNIPINITSLFAFIMTLGIVVDDAIVIGESVYDYSNKHGHSTDNVIKGTLRVSKPVIFGVLTTAAVFMPLLFATGNDAGDFIDLSTVVILCLALSLIESKLILPAHLAQHPWNTAKTSQWREKIDQWLNNLVNNTYQPFLTKCLNNKLLVVSAFVSFALVSTSLLTAGWVKEVYMPSVAADTLEVSVRLHTSTTQEQTYKTQVTLEQQIQNINQHIQSDYGQPVIADVLSHISNQGNIELAINLVPEDSRAVDAFEVSRQLYPLFSGLPGVKSVEIVDEAISNNNFNGIGYRFYSKSLEDVNAATLAFIEGLNKIEGINNINSTVKPSVREVNFTLLPYAEALGLTPATVAEQVNYALYGIEAQRINRGGSDIRVMVRYPKSLREQRSTLKYIRIQTPNGDEVLLGDIATFHEKQGVSQVRREKGYRSTLVIADVADNANINAIYDHIYSDIFPTIKANYPSVTTDISAKITEQQEQKDQMLLFGVIGILLVYILLSVPLQSYTQPIIIMLVIPFSLFGSIWGHWLLGYELSLFSQFGMIAAAGVVINASLVLISAINEAIKTGMTLQEAIIFGANSRFRAIMLTSITTFVGLLPIMMETSVQGRYVVPMAISIAFSLVVATAVTLALIPVVFLIHHKLVQKLLFTKQKSLVTKTVVEQ